MNTSMLHVLSKSVRAYAQTRACSTHAISLLPLCEQWMPQLQALNRHGLPQKRWVLLPFVYVFDSRPCSYGQQFYIDAVQGPEGCSWLACLDCAHLIDIDELSDHPINQGVLPVGAIISKTVWLSDLNGKQQQQDPQFVWQQEERQQQCRPRKCGYVMSLCVWPKELRRQGLASMLLQVRVCANFGSSTLFICTLVSFLWVSDKN